MTGRSGAAAGTRSGGLRKGNKLLHRIDRNGRMHDQHISGGCDDRDQPEVLVRIEGQFLEEARIYGKCRAEHQSPPVNVSERPAVAGQP